MTPAPASRQRKVANKFMLSFGTLLAGCPAKYYCSYCNLSQPCPVFTFTLQPSASCRRYQETIQLVSKIHTLVHHVKLYQNSGEQTYFLSKSQLLQLWFKPCYKKCLSNDGMSYEGQNIYLFFRCYSYSYSNKHVIMTMMILIIMI